MTTSDQMIINGFGTKGLAELNHHMRDEQKETRGGGSGEGRVLLEEDESRINEDVEDRDRTESVQAQAAVIQRQQQQPQGHIVRWERFLHVRSLKVLLVENDDSTRHVVSAFLRNCSYEVTAVENGLQAWKILEDLTNHIDLVLTEVVVPFLSGFGLLQKIMSHNICKNIPVIMMSSHDSVGIVFKCLSKGAVDFLVKPIRKNELKNLWQHVWRKCRSSSGSASESGVRTLKSAKLESAEESDNSNDEDNNGSIGPNDRNGSDHGSGTQSSWTKLAVEVDSPQPMSQLNQLADPPYSTYGRVNYSRAKAFSDNLVSTTATRKRHEQDDELDKSAIGKDLNIGVPKQPNLQLEFPTDKVLNNTVGINKDKILESNSRKEQFKKGQMTLNTEKLRNPAADLIDVVANSTDPQIESLNFEIPNGDSYISESKDKAIYDTKEMSSLEISLKWLTDIEDNGTSANTRNIWRHSNLSAFSRYNSSATANQAPTGNVGSYLPPDKSSEAAKTEPMHNFQSNSDGYLPFQRSNGTSNNNDMGSTTNNAFTKPAVFNDKPAPVKFLNLSSAFQPVQNSHISPRQPNLPSRADAVTANTVLAQARETHQQVQVHHRHHHYFHHHHHHVHNLPQQQQLPKDEELSLKNMSAAAQQCGSSNVWRAPISGNVGNHSLNGSASGSNHGSNGQNGSSIAVNNGGINMENDIDIFENGGGAVSGSGRSGEYQNHLARRVAALNKFRLKRKDRCFDKKVRYQSRKRLAEQRPRVRGQFVRQVACADKIEDTDS